LQLAFADRRGVVRLVDVDTRRVLWRGRPGKVVALAWSADGARLAAVTASRVRILTGAGRLAATLAVPAGTRAVAAAYAPRGRTLAVLRRTAAASEIVLVSGRRQRLLTRSPGQLAGLAWSPDGRLLLVGWQSADEWLFLPVEGGKPTAAGEIAAEFAPGADAPAGYPRIEGWVSGPG
jgi:hypothetical protein